jgi:16S rRNA processing protein RimM
MKEDQMVTVGKVRDAHGLKGELFIILFSGEAAWAEELKTATLVRRERVKKPDGTEITEDKTYSFPIKRFKAHKKGLILKVDGIDTRTEAEGFSGALFQIENENLISEPGEKIFLKEIEGFDVTDKRLGRLGKITGFSTNNAQDLIVVGMEQGTVEIPLVPEFIVALNFKTKTLAMDLPEGLVPTVQ